MVRAAACFLAGVMVPFCVADTMSFLAIGDWGGSNDTAPTTPGEIDNNAAMGAVSRRLNDTAFVLALGDNFYYAGITGDASQSPRFAQTFEDVFTSPYLQVPWYVVAGNHDHKGNVSAQIAYSDMSERWTFPALWYTFERSFYSKQAGRNITTQVVYLDTVLMCGMSYHDEVTGEFVAATRPEDKQVAASQRQWLEKQLQASTADYLWVAGHYPVYSQCMHGPTIPLIAEVLPLLEQYNATGYISGHDHCMAHIVDNSLAFIVSGAGKECCYDPTHELVLPRGSLKFQMDSRHTYNGTQGGFASFEVSAETTIVTYYNNNGTVLYTSAPIPARRKA